MAIFVPNNPLAGFNVSTGSLQGPSIVLDELTKTSIPSFLINGGAVGNEFFISSSNFNVKANGDISASNALLAGTITATAGFIGGWTIGSTTLTGGNVVLDSTGKIRTATNFTTGNGFYFDDQATNNFRVGLAGGSRLQFTGTNIEIYSSNNRVVSLGTTNEIAGFGLTPAAISSSNNQLVLRSNGQITGSSVLFDGGKIGGWSIDGNKLSSGNVTLNATNQQIFLGDTTYDAAEIAFTGSGIGKFGSININGVAGALNGGIAFLDTFNGTELDSTLWYNNSSDAGEKARIVSGALRLENGNGAWDYAIVGKKAFQRANSPVFEFHTKVLQTGGTETLPRMMLGVTEDAGTTNYAGNVHAFYFSNTGMSIYEGATSRGAVSGFAAAVGDTFKLVMKPQSSGIQYEVYKNEDYTTAYKTGTIGSSNSASLYPAIWTLPTASTMEFYSVAAYDSTTPGAFDLKGGGSFGLIDNSGSRLTFTRGGFSLSSPNVDISGRSIRIGDAFKFDGSNLTVSGSSARILTPSFFLGGTNQYISGSGGLLRISSSNFHLDTSGNVTMAGTITAQAGTIGGWSIGSTYLSSSNLIIDSAGNLQTANYASDLTGWKISSAGNGFAEFENVKVRGTLSTAVFEKQSVNAVGGQLYVANSTILTGSGEAGASTNGQYTATQTTMSVENVTGFENGEIITAKKFSGTGFGTEYMRINSASRANPSSDTDFSGRIYVTRGYGSGTTGNSGSLGETPGAGQTYSGSQVIVSTGKLGTGFIRINASPSDQATPYIDIVERTGSGIYDVALKARLGDLSGLANSSYVFGNSNPGFGLATDNVFLQGGIVANTGSIGGISMQSSKLFTGTGTFNNSNTGFYLDSSGQFSLKSALSWDGTNLLVSGSTTRVLTPSFFLGGTNQYISGSNGTIRISSSNFHLDTAGNVTMAGTVSATAGTIGGFAITSTAISSSNDDLILRSNGQITGSNILLDGGRIGGFNLDSNRLYSTTNLPATSIPAIDINGTTGAISGSSVLLRRRISGTTYTLMDTEEGVADFRNIGRQVIADATEYARTSTSDETTNYTDLAEWSFNVLPGETNLLIGWNWLTHSATYSAVSRLRWQLAYLSAAQSGSSTTSAAYYNAWTSGSTSTHTISISANNSGSAWEVPNSTIGRDGANFTISSYEGSIIRIRLQLANDIANATGNMTTKVRDVCAYTTRTYGVAAAGGVVK